MHKRYSKGFTIVEFLIVILVVSLLSSIVVVAYRSVQDRANDAIVQSDLQALGKKMELFKAESGGYPLLNDMKALNFKASYNSYDKTYYNFHYCVRSTDRSEYSIQARSVSKNTFYQKSGIKKNPNKATPYWEDNCANIGYGWTGNSTGFNAQYGYNFGNSSWQQWL